jgi:hypothetical protein
MINLIFILAIIIFGMSNVMLHTKKQFDVPNLTKDFKRIRIVSFILIVVIIIEKFTL